MRLKWLMLLYLVSSWCCVHSLKCRSQEGFNDAELKRVVRTCMQRNSSQDDRDNEDNRGRSSNARRNFDYNQGQQESNNYNQRWQRSTKQSNRDWDRNSRDSRDSANGGTGEQGQCVAQCFFEELNMVDGNGLPDRRKVSYLLTKDLRDRELRNFYMDTVQQCFGYLDNTRNRNNKCSQSKQLIKCMSEYAKAQCDDWEENSNIIFT